MSLLWISAKEVIALLDIDQGGLRAPCHLTSRPCLPLAQRLKIA